MTESPRISSPVPTSRNNASAISPVTITVRKRLCERPAVAARLSSFRLVLISVREAFSAGTKPHSAAEATEIARTKNQTIQAQVIGTELTYQLKLKVART